MIIKHDRHILGEIHEVRKGTWAFISWLCFSGADWLREQTHMQKLLIRSVILLNGTAGSKAIF